MLGKRCRNRGNCICSDASYPPKGSNRCGPEREPTSESSRWLAAERPILYIYIYISMCMYVCTVGGRNFATLEQEYMYEEVTHTM